VDAYFGTCFESLCREALPLLYLREGISAAFEVGEYWDANVQIDVVGLRQDGWTDLGECRFGALRSLRAVAAELAARASCYPNRRAASLAQRIFVRQAPRQKDDGAFRLHDLADLYGED